MGIRIFILALVTLASTTSCEMIQKEVNKTFKVIEDQQSHTADSLRHVFISQRQNYNLDTAFSLKMDTLYEKGFLLADLSDSLRIHPDDQDLIDDYHSQIFLFCNYVNHNFDYEYGINTNETMIGNPVAGEDHNTKARSAPQFMAPMMFSMVKPAIMNIILSCRYQYPYPDPQKTATPH